MEHSRKPQPITIARIRAGTITAAQILASTLPRPPQEPRP